MVGTSELGVMFKEGKTKGQASRTTIIEGKNKTYLVDYGWAVLAERDKITGKVTFYKGWYGYSPTTSKHMSQLGFFGAENVKKERKMLSEVMR